MTVGHAREAGGDTALQLVEEMLLGALDLPDERGLDERWSRAMDEVRQYTLRPGKRVRPTLLLSGYALARGPDAPREVAQFAAALELLHTFLLIHDDVADRASSRRGGLALHRLLGEGRTGEDLAIVTGDHLFARSMELMLGAELPGSAEASRYMLAVCRHTAAGQYLDLQLAKTPLEKVTLFQTLKVANLKTARYGFVAPLVCGVLLARGPLALRETLERVGRHVGLAYQLRDDLLGLFGDERLSGKSASTDYFEGKRTFPLIAALARADQMGRRRLISLWEREDKDERALLQAREELRRHGGVAATVRAIERSTRAATRALRALPDIGGARARLDQLITQLARRVA